MEVVGGNRLRGEILQKEVDHLNWANEVNALLTDDRVTTLDVETDDHKCGFGIWLYGEGRKKAEALVPSLVPILKSIEEPHKKLHLVLLYQNKQQLLHLYLGLEYAHSRLLLQRLYLNAQRYYSQPQ